MEAGTVVTHPNRNTPETNSARFLVIVLLLVSIGLMLGILIFGWSALEGMGVVAISYVIVYGIITWRVSDWARGPLVVGAALAIILAIFGAIAVPTWADRDAPGYASPEAIWGSGGLPASVLGLLTVILVVVQIVLIAAAIRAFRQEWQVELEVPAGSTGGTDFDSDGLDLDDPAPGGSLPEPGAY